MRELYEYPGQNRDLLFQPDYPHAQSGEECSFCDPANIIRRGPRDYDEHTQVHYGLIASSNSIVKDANVRDQIGTELNAICIDYEASGLMSYLPCLMIRGVADYADSHKNAGWHGYAALAASAYTKRLLSVITVTTNEGIAAVASLDPDLSNAYRSGAEVDDGNSMSSNTSVGSMEASDAGIRISAAKKVAQALISDERLRSICVTASLRLKRDMLQWNIFVALGILWESLSERPRTPVILGLRWLFNRYRQHIAASVTEIVCDQETSLGVGQIETTLRSDEILTRLLKIRFPAANVAIAAVNRTHPEEVPTMSLEDIDMETLEPHDDAILTDLTQLDEILCRGTGFEDMLGKLKELLFPPVHVLLENTLGTYLAKTQGDPEVVCLVEWELLQLVNSEGLDVKDIDCLFTLSGDFENARADPLADHEIWHTGKQLLETVKSCLVMASKDMFDPVDTELKTGDLTKPDWSAAFQERYGS